MIPLNTTDTTLIRVPLLIYNSGGDLDATAAASGAELQTSINGAAWVNAAGTLVPTGGGAYYYQGVAADVATRGKLTVKFAKTGFLTSMANDDVDAPTTILGYGTAQAGGATSITLASGASATNDLYNDGIITIVGGLGVGQVNTITDYVGGTKIATVARTWGINPDATSRYIIGPAPASANVSGLAAAVWSEACEGAHTYGDAMRLQNGVLAGQTTNYTTGTIAAKSLNAAKTRITWTVDETGRLTAVPGDLT